MIIELYIKGDPCHRVNIDDFPNKRIGDLSFQEDFELKEKLMEMYLFQFRNQMLPVINNIVQSDVTYAIIFQSKMHLVDINI